MATAALQRPPRPADDRTAPLSLVLLVTFFGSVSGGAFWTGVFFLTARDYQFSALRNLALGATMGAAYAAAALTSGRLVGLLSRLLSARGVIIAALLAQAVVAAGPVLLPRQELVLWPAAVIGVSSSAVVWPIVESFLSAGRHGPALRSALGVFNLTWTPAVAVSLLLVPVVGTQNLMFAAIGITLVVNAIAIAAASRLPRNPAHHDVEIARAHIGDSYPRLLQATLWLLPMSYVLMANLSPILPYRLSSLGVHPRFETLAAATWMLARFASLLVLWRTRFWHGRWAPLLLGALGLLAGFGCVVLAPSLAVLLSGLALFGAAMGVLYFASIYYSMSVGHAAVQAGGLFEGLIGVGYFVGPLLGVVGRAAEAPSLTVGLCWLVALAASWPAVRGAWQARRQP